MNELDVILEPLDALRRDLHSCVGPGWDDTVVHALRHRQDYVDALVREEVQPGSTWRERFELACKKTGWIPEFHNGTLRGVRRAE
jgi:hypothetical protein